jgi:microcystin-dependent protein
MINYLSTFVNTDGNAFPTTAAVNSSGPGTTDGTEFVKAMIDDMWGFNQALLDYTDDTPSGVSEAAGLSQRLDSILKITANITSYTTTSNHTVYEWDKRGIVIVESGVVTLSLLAGTGCDETNRVMIINQSGGAVTIDYGSGTYSLLNGQVIEYVYNTVTSDFEDVSGRFLDKNTGGTVTGNLNVTGKVKESTYDLIPTGTIQMFAGAAAPSGWLMADGTAVSRTTYASLFAVCGTTYGAGDGSTTFNLPDFRGAAPAGVGTSTGYTTNETVTLGQKINDRFQGHLAEIFGADNLGSGTGISGATAVSVSGATGTINNGYKSTFGGSADKVTKLGSDGTNGTPRTGTTTKTKSLGINFIIKI